MAGQLRGRRPEGGRGGPITVTVAEAALAVAVDDDAGVEGDEAEEFNTGLGGVDVDLIRCYNPVSSLESWGSRLLLLRVLNGDRAAYPAPERCAEDDK